MSSVRLTTTSYLVLGLVELCQPATPYEIKQASETTTAFFWTLAHTQLYTECTRLAREGLLEERQEETGRRRKLYTVTEEGTAALDAWRAEATTEFPELRDPGVLKVFFGAKLGPLAEAQLDVHRRRLQTYEQLAENELPERVRLALECGLGHEREYVRYWQALTEE